MRYGVHEPVSYLELLDWRRQMADLFSELRRRPADTATLTWLRSQKDVLFSTHPQSPLPPDHRARLEGIRYWPFDPESRVHATLEEVEEDSLVQPSSTGEEPRLVRIGRLRFRYKGATCALAAFWIAGYGGGLFVPFRDGTSGAETYGGGRYLIDSIKSADLGSDMRTGTVVLDFNYAYHPSCAYAPHWSCPLAPPSNRLAMPVRAGERL
jgi:uncharacterized protein